MTGPHLVPRADSPGDVPAVREFDADVVCAASFPLNHMTYPFRRPEPRPPIVLVPASHTTNDWAISDRI